MTENQDATASFPLAGHCLCGKVHYRLLGPPRWTGYCHCESCRRATGSVGVVYAGFVQDLVEIEGPVAEYASSPGVTRSFCPHCGTPIAYRSTRWPDETHILVGSMDNPAALPPAHHYHVDEQIPWLQFDDHLPRHGKPEN
ncbi:MAG TPA: GFA family protein [Dongiaceae bacterium]|nr:GFA family protein [Dongiaceae bacterium]